jgi:diadenosine tetraphosphate (Ap4A) HIT family hydrolase
MAMSRIEAEGSLPSEKPWVLFQSDKKSISEGQGEHLILHAPRDVTDIFGDGFRRDELSRDDRGELFHEAVRCAALLSLQLNREGYYRIEFNGPEAGSRPSMHFHIIAACRGVTFRRCVDPIVATAP